MLEYLGRFVEVDGNRIHYLEYGDGPPVLLMHGGGAGCAIWLRQIENAAHVPLLDRPDEVNELLLGFL